MKSNRLVNIALLLSFSILSGLLLGSCASVPAASGNPIAVELLSREQIIQKFGMDQKQNPFIAPTGIIKGRPYEFVVLNLSTSLANKTPIDLTIEARDKDGNATFTLWDKKDFKEMWLGWDGGEAKTINREALIDDYYIPGDSFSAPKGKGQYYIVLIGKNPLNHPLKVTITVGAAGMPPFVRSFSID